MVGSPSVLGGGGGGGEVQGLVLLLWDVGGEVDCGGLEGDKGAKYLREGNFDTFMLFTEKDANVYRLRYPSVTLCQNCPRAPHF